MDRARPCRRSASRTWPASNQLKRRWVQVWMVPVSNWIQSYRSAAIGPIDHLIGPVTWTPGDRAIPVWARKRPLLTLRDSRCHFVLAARDRADSDRKGKDRKWRSSGAHRVVRPDGIRVVSELTTAGVCGLEKRLDNSVSRFPNDRTSSSMRRE